MHGPKGHGHDHHERGASLTAALLFKNGSFEIERSQLQASKLQLALHGRDALGTLGMDFRFALPDLAALSPVLAGQIDGQGQLQGVAPRLALSADLNGMLSAHGSPPGPLRLTLRARDLPQHANGRIEVSGTLDAAPLQLAASLERNADGTLAARIERGEWKSARLGGALSVDTAASDPEGHLELHVAHLEDLDRLLGQSVQGSLDAGVLFNRAAGHSRAQITVDAHDAGIPVGYQMLASVLGSPAGCIMAQGLPPDGGCGENVLLADMLADIADLTA